MVIVTDRLTLRRMTLADLKEYLALHENPDVVRFIRGVDRDTAIERLQANDRQWEEHGYGLMAICDRRDGTFLGRVSLWNVAEFDEVELGWSLHRFAWGRGVATEAARAYMTWAWENLSVPYLTSMIRSDNGRSVDVALRLGMSVRRTELRAGLRVLVYAIARDRETVATP